MLNTAQGFASLLRVLPALTIRRLGRKLEFGLDGAGLHIKVDDRSLRVVVAQAGQEVDAAAWHRSQRVGDALLLVCGSYYELYAIPEEGPELRWRGDQKLLHDMLLARGGIWAMVDAGEWAITSHTVAIDLPAVRWLHARSRLRSSESFIRKITPLTIGPFEAVDLQALHNELFADSTVDLPECSNTVGSARLRPALSGVFDFGGTAGPGSRGDFIGFERYAQDHLLHEFYVRPTGSTVESSYELDLLAYNLIYLLGIRRTKLFRAAYARRQFSVTLPPLVLRGERHQDYAMVPVVLLTRLPASQTFRRTLSVSFIITPLSRREVAQPFAPRVPSVAEVASTTNELSKAAEYSASDRGRTFRTEGPQVAFSGLPSQVTIPNAISLILLSVVKRLAGPNYSERIVSRGMRESSVSSVCYLVPWVDREDVPWVRWCSGEVDERLEHEFHRLAFWDDYGERRHAFSTSRTVNFQSLSIGNAHGADMSGLTLYNPQVDTKFVLYPSKSEAYPNHSVLRWFAWQIYLDSAVASVRALLGRFHDTIDTAVDLRAVLTSAQSLATELSEVFDLDLADFFYRREYEALRQVLRLDQDYEYMRGRLLEAQGQSSLREQIMMNNLILALTLSGLLATTMVAFGQAVKWKAEFYLAGGAIVLGVALAVSFGILEPLQRWRAVKRANNLRSTSHD